MKRWSFLLLLLAGTLGVSANNVRIVKDVSVDPASLSGGFAELKFSIAWDNSWRDDFNWDAVYVFLKYKRTTETTWSHALFSDNYHEVSNGYSWWPAQFSATANQHQGVFIFRSEKKRGDAEVDVTLKWNVGLASPALTATDFEQGNVEMALMCVEMVYVPQGAFYLGDGVSTNTFKTNYRPILPEWDLIKDDGTQKYTASETMAGFSVEAPANRVNEGRNQMQKNGWRSNAGKAAIWKVELPEAKAVRYFGVSGVRGYPTYTPTSWTFEGSVNGEDQWVSLVDGLDQNSWVCGDDSYPVSKAIAVDKTKIKPYRFYRVRIITAGNGVMMNNFSMTDKDLSKVNDNGYVVDGQSIVMNATTGLSSDDGDKWAATLNANYPTGFQGFYAMKYEISQEQYVRFLNKLTAEQQKTRTREDLDDLEPGDYVFGNDKSKASSRNGIIVGSRINGVVIFANNLNPANNFSQEDDGQTLGCNFLSVNDMLAYADWAGLRPLSEMEYEKMARRPYPNSPGLKDWAGGSDTEVKMPVSESFTGTAGKFDERLSNANVNAGGKVSGPVRVGSFAKGATRPSEAGASYWGIMDLSGNLAEIYYNANTYGRSFTDQINGLNHGNGVLKTVDPQGNADMNTAYWPTAQVGAFGLRGGSYMSEVAGVSKGEIAVGDRSKTRCFSSLDQRDSTVSFRVGHSYTFLNKVTYNSYIQLENGKLSSTGAGQFDSVCVNTTYTIKGSELLDASNNPVDFKGRTNYIWYMSDNSGDTWHIIPGQNSRDLVYSDWRDQSDAVRDVRIKREVLTPIGMHMTNYVILRVVNVNYNINRLVDTVKMSNQAMGFFVESSLPSSFTWRWKSAEPGSSNLEVQNSAAKYSYYVPKREDFGDIANQNHVVQCEIKVLGKCVKREEVKVYVEERREVGISSSDITMGGNDPSKECGVLMADTRSTESGKVYATVKIGKQCWMAENLRYSGLSNVYGTKPGDPDGSKYGFLYKYSKEVINNVCPAGWRMPTNTDFNELMAYMETIGKGSVPIGYLLASGNYWNITSADKMPTNATGFGAIGAGWNIGVTTELFSYAYFVTSDNKYYYLNIANGTFAITASNSYWSSNNSYYMSVRCIKR